ncbi:VIT1/CCC1 transporter family protein [Candidatus Woesebacteria bacterium]|nr:VIT1/CCC1 transporter family protein [Candidatus Woesebacteria bacterium]
MKRQLVRAQENEITEYHIYKKLADIVKDENIENSKVLEKIAEEEKKHSEFWKGYTEEDPKPKRFKIFFHNILARLFGLTFSVKLMEQGEELAQVNYSEIAKEIPEAEKIEKEEGEHEKKLLGLLDEERLKYVGSMVLGVNDALVELTGALAGLTLAFQNTRLIALTGLITGIAASLSMGASEYLSVKAEDKEKEPVKASIYTGGMYVVTVMILIFPYFIFTNIYYSLALTLFNAIFIILLFTFYISVAQDLPFKKRFFEMAGISLGVSALTFGIGYIVRNTFGIDM